MAGVDNQTITDEGPTVAKRCQIRRSRTANCRSRFLLDLEQDCSATGCARGWIQVGYLL